MKHPRAMMAVIAAVSLLMAGVAGVAGASAAGGERAAETDYFDVQKTDPYGQPAIAVLGDSISHGANCPKIYEQSYISLVKQALWEKTGVENYGFASIENSLWNGLGRYDEVHQTRWDTNIWQEERIDADLGRMRVSASKKGLSLDFTVAKNFKSFYVYYEKNANGGTFDVVTSDGRTSVDTTQGLDGYSTVGRSEAIPFPADGKFSLEITSEGKPVGINGVGYYQDPSQPVINNYASNGSKLIDVSDEIIQFACRADTLIMAHGYNDSHFDGSNPDNQKEFTRKIDLIIETVKQTGCRVIVHDMAWGFGSQDFYRKELARLASETGGLYVSAQDEYGQAILDMLNDNVHPSPEGHRVIGEYLISKMRGEAAPTLPDYTPQGENIWLLDESKITSGAENVTVNEDGSWSITGDVDIAPGVRYNYNDTPNLSQSFDSDVPYTIGFTDNLSGKTFDLGANLVENVYKYPLGVYEMVQGISGIYTWSVQNADWPDTKGAAQVDAIAIRLDGEGTLTIRSLAITSGGLIVDPPSGEPTTTEPAETTTEPGETTTEPAETTTTEPSETTTEPGESTKPSLPGTPGELDGEPGLTVKDSQILFNGVSGSYAFSDEEKKASDINDDGVLNMADAYLLYLIVSGNDAA